MGNSPERIWRRLCGNVPRFFFDGETNPVLPRPLSPTLAEARRSDLRVPRIAVPIGTECLSLLSAVECL